MELVKLVKLQWDRSLALALAVAGGVTLFIGWFRVSDGLVVTQQVPYVVSAGLGGIFLLGVAATLWLSADFRDEWRALQDLAKSGGSTGGEADPTLVEGGYEPVDVTVLYQRIEELEARLAAVETRSTRSRSRKLTPSGSVTPSLAD